MDKAANHYSESSNIKLISLMFVLLVSLGLAGCSSEEETATTQLSSSSAERDTPRYADGTVRFDRVPGEKGYWDNASVSSLFESGVTVEMDDKGLLADIESAEQVAPFMPWALALYQYRQANGLKDDPINACISPAGPRHMHVDGGFRIIQDRNYDRVYVMFGGGNRNWRLIHMDGRTPPDPEEVVGTYYGHSTGHWEGDTLVVESSGFNDRFWFSNGGLPHSEALHLIERFSRPDYNTLQYEVTIEDTRTYTRPWKSEWTLEWVEGEIAETFCEDTL
ncbi:hypothetical protein OAP18_03680 [Gammaproteobacteria bacterium]|nr:hypothetical protein [Gammaproteobacteria bacterium]